MKGFLLLASNDSSGNFVNERNVEAELGSRKLVHFKRTYECNLYNRVLGYQFLDKEEKDITQSNFLFAGDISGSYEEFNDGILSYKSSIEYLSNHFDPYSYLPIEGSSAVCAVYKDKIVFQNDLEGRKRIFYYKSGDLLCVSNYLPILLKAISKDWKVRKNAVLSYLLGREAKWPLTFIEDVFLLSPLSLATVKSEEVKITSITFSNLYELRKISKEELKEQLYNQYKKASFKKVTERTAVTLSGGFDSNCLTKLHKELLNNNFTAVSVGYVAEREGDQNIYDETVYAKKIAEKLNIQFKRYLIGKEEFFDSFEEFISKIDQPGHDPSSNFILNKYLNIDGFDTVVNGMGGDANFSSRRYLSWALSLSQFSHLKINRKIIKLLGRQVYFKGPFSYFKTFLSTEDENHASFHDLFERVQLFNNPLAHLFALNSKKEIDQERHARSYFFDNVYSKHKTRQELYFSLALFCNPDEYHASVMAERNNMNISMPFINTGAAISMMNGSHFNNDVLNRGFETNVFGGINKDFLAKKKSGFSIPYSEWMQNYSEEVFSFYESINYFSKENFNLLAFKKSYVANPVFRTSLAANVIIWKLLVVKHYVEKNHLIW